MKRGIFSKQHTGEQTVVYTYAIAANASLGLPQSARLILLGIKKATTAT